MRIGLPSIMPITGLLSNKTGSAQTGDAPTKNKSANRIKLIILITLKSNITHNLLGDRKRHLPFHGLKNNYNSLIGEKTELVVKKFHGTLALTFQLRVCQRLLKNLVRWTSGQNKTAKCSMRGTARDL